MCALWQHGCMHTLIVTYLKVTNHMIQSQCWKSKVVKLAYIAKYIYHEYWESFFHCLHCKSYMRTYNYWFSIIKCELADLVLLPELPERKLRGVLVVGSQFCWECGWVPLKCGWQLAFHWTQKENIHQIYLSESIFLDCNRRGSFSFRNIGRMSKCRVQILIE